MHLTSGPLSEVPTAPNPLNVDQRSRVAHVPKVRPAILSWKAEDAYIPLVSYAAFVTRANTREFQTACGIQHIYKHGRAVPQCSKCMTSPLLRFKIPGPPFSPSMSRSLSVIHWPNRKDIGNMTQVVMKTPKRWCNTNKRRRRKDPSEETPSRCPAEQGATPELEV